MAFPTRDQLLSMDYSFKGKPWSKILVANLEVTTLDYSFQGGPWFGQGGYNLVINTQPVGNVSALWIGGSYTFTCVATGTGTVHYQWYSFTNPLDKTPIGTDSTSLSLTNLQLTDSLYYQCQTTDETTEEWSDIVSLLVGDPYLVITTQPIGLTMNKGDGESITVVVEGKDPVYQWYSIELGCEIPWATDVLDLTKLQSFYSGGFKCTISNEFNEVTTNTVYVTINDPSPIIPIGSWIELAKIGVDATNYPLDGRYILTCNLSNEDPDYDGIGNNWRPIGFDEFDNRYSVANYEYFSGTFDGNNYTISDLYRRVTDDNRIPAIDDDKDYGLFGILREGAIINLNIGNVYFKHEYVLYVGSYRYYSVGGLVGCVTGTSTILNCSVNGELTDDQTYYVGGLIGRIEDIDDDYVVLNHVLIHNCTTNISIIYDPTSYYSTQYRGGFLGYSYCDPSQGSVSLIIDSSAEIYFHGGSEYGGFAGSVSGITFKNCHVSGDIVDAYYMGGFAYYVGRYGRCILNNCSHVGNMTVGGGSGFLEQLWQDCTCIDCYSIGNITSIDDNDYTVGFIEWSEGIVERCYVEGDLISPTIEAAGFILNTRYGSIKDCYYSGNITAEEAYGFNLTYWNYVTIENCYCSGNITATTKAAGFSNGNGTTYDLSPILIHSYSASNIISGTTKGDFFLDWSRQKEALLNCGVLAQETPKLDMFPYGRTTDLWTRQTADFIQSWSAVCWSPELGLFAAVADSTAGTAGRIMTSPDGTNWTQIFGSADSYVWYDICWSPELGKFCAVGLGVSMVSSNGTSWTVSSTISSSRNYKSVCWSSELGKFCAISTHSESKCITSDNGLTWDINTMGGSTGWQSVCWSPELGKFCAIGGSGTTFRWAISTDGIVWSISTKSTSVNMTWASVCWAPEIGEFSAVGRLVSFVWVERGINFTSTDGINWSSHFLGTTYIQYFDKIIWCNELETYLCLCTTPSNDSYNDHWERVHYKYPEWGWVESVNAEKVDPGDICYSPELGLFVVVMKTAPTYASRVRTMTAENLRRIYTLTYPISPTGGDGYIEGDASWFYTKEAPIYSNWDFDSPVWYEWYEDFPHLRYQPLLITRQPESGARYETKSYTFTVEVAPRMYNMSYQWYKDGDIVPGATSLILALTNLTIDDSGEYFCRITSPYEVVDSNTATLVVVAIEASATVKPICIFYPVGRGSFYNQYSLQITKHPNPFVFEEYVLDIMNIEKEIVESFNISFDVNSKDANHNTLYIEDILSKYSKIIRVMMVRENSEISDGYNLVLRTLDKNVGNVIVTSNTVTDTRNDFTKWEQNSESEFFSYCIICKDSKHNFIYGWIGETSLEGSTISVWNNKEKESASLGWLGDTSSFSFTSLITYEIRVSYHPINSLFENRISMRKGSEGALLTERFRDFNKTEAASLLVRGYSGTLNSPIVNDAYVDEVVDSDRNYFSLVFDAGYPSEVKDSISALPDIRGDCFAIIDNGDNSRSAVSIDTRNNTHKYNTMSTALFECYSSIYDSFTNKDIWTTPVYHLASIIPKTDKNKQVGKIFTVMDNVIKSISELRYSPTFTERDQLYLKQINPLIDSSIGYMFNSQVTTLAKTSDLQNINCARAFIYVRTAIKSYCNNYIFKENNIIIWDKVKTDITRFMESIKNREAITSYSVDVGATPAELKLQKFHVDVIISLAKVTERIELNFFIS